MDYESLKTEITTDPEGLGYAPYLSDGSDQAIANLMNQRPETFSPAKTWTATNPLIPMSSVLIWGASGPLASLYVGVANANASVSAACRAALALLTLPSVTTFNPLSAAQSALLAGMVQANVFTQAQVDALVSLTEVPASRAEVLFGQGTVVNHNDIAKARTI